MKNNTLTSLLALPLLLLSFTFFGMQQQNNQTNSLKRWILKLRTVNFDDAMQIIDNAQTHAPGNVLSASLDNVDNAHEVSIKLKGSHSELVQKLKDQPWFKVENLHEEQKN